MLSDEELLIKACTVVSGYVQPMSIPTSEQEAAQFLDSLDAETESLLLDWCEDVLDTHESGTSLRDNGGELLNVPLAIRDWFDWDAQARLIEPMLDANEEARKKLDSELEELFVAMTDAKSEREKCELAAKNAMKAHELAQEAFTEKYQQLRELRRTGSPQNSSADPIAAQPIAVLSIQQLNKITNGRSNGAGIARGTVALLTDSGIATIGDLEAHMRQHSERWASQIKGIGPGKADRISDALQILRTRFA